MSNNCYNTFTFFGNQAVLDQVEQWSKALEASIANDPSSDRKTSSRPLIAVFLPEELDKGDLTTLCNKWFGQKWVYPDFGGTLTLNQYELGFISAWEPSNKLQDLLTRKLYELDKGVVLLNTIKSDESEEAFRYTAIRKDGIIFSADSELELEDEGDIDSADYALFYEHHIDSIEDLVDECPAAKKNIKQHLKKINVLFEEETNGDNSTNR